MKIYTLFTPSHQQMHDEWFLKTLPNEFEIDETIIEQECETGVFYNKGWHDTTNRKVETFLRAAEENDGELFVFSDVDIQFFKPIKNDLIEEIGDKDIAIQHNGNHNECCTGFFICKGNNKTRDYFNRMLKNFKKEKVCDQKNFNNRGKGKYLNIHMLPKNKYWNVFNSIKKTWNGDQDFNIPKEEIRMHHANWVIGLERKNKLLKKVRKKYYE